MRSAAALPGLVLLAAAIPVAGAQPPPGFSPLFSGSLGEAEILNGGTFTIQVGILRA
jgi:hypothetical protein